MRNLLILWALLSCISAFAQPEFEITNPTDETSLQLFLKKDWESLQNLEETNPENLSYITQYRIALANYYSGKVLKASGEFVRLHEENRLDSNVLKSAYYSLIEIGFTAKAADIRKRALPYYQRILPEVSLKPISNLSLGYGHSIAQQLARVTSGLEAQNTYQEADLMKGSDYNYIAFDGQINSKWTYKADYSLITLQRTRQFDYQSIDSVGTTPSTFTGLFGEQIAYDSTIYKTQSVQTNKGILLWQNQLYGSISYQHNLRLDFTGFGLIGNYRYQTLTSNYSDETYLAQSYHLFNSVKPSYTYSETFETQQFWIGGAEVGFYNKSLNFRNAIGVSRGYLNNGYTSQAQYTTTWYPKQNYDLGLRLQVTAVKSDSTDAELIYNLLFTKVLSRKFIVSINGTYGNFKNAHTENGRVLFNYPDNGKYRVAASIGYKLAKQLSLGFTLSYTNMEVVRTLYNSIDGFTTNTQSFKLYFPLLSLNYQL